MDFSLGYTEAALQIICGDEQGFLEFAQSLYIKEGSRKVTFVPK